MKRKSRIQSEPINVPARYKNKSGFPMMRDDPFPIQMPPKEEDFKKDEFPQQDRLPIVKNRNRNKFRSGKR